jgi:hypothetical protein
VYDAVQLFESWTDVITFTVHELDEAAYRKFLHETAGVLAPGKKGRKPKVRVVG